MRDWLADSRYRSRKWLGFLLITLGTFVLTAMGTDMAGWIQWISIGYPVFCGANAALKWKGLES